MAVEAPASAAQNDGTAQPLAQSSKQVEGSSGSNGSTGVDPKRFLTQKARSTAADGIRGLIPLEKPGVVSFCRAGRPNPATFPFAAITIDLKPPLGHDASDPSKTKFPEKIVIDGEDLDVALQYGPTPGLHKLVNTLENVQARVHKRQKGTFGISVGNGSQDMMYKGFMSVLERGDPVMLETPLYAGALPAIKMLDAEMVEIDVDEQGLSAVNLEKTLAEWPEGKKRPRVVYSTPVGCNPSGCSASRERKLAVLEVCKKYDVLIFEDDPYYYLTEDLIPSYFELETEVFPEGGHVLRFDSFSKVLSAGMRLGWATGPKEIIDAISVQTSGASLHMSSIPQVIAYRLLDTWGIDGFISHCRAVAVFYAERRDVFEAIARKHLGDLATWVSPVAGMFLWIDLSPAGITDTYELVRHEAYKKGVLAVPGYAFYPSGRKSSHVRVAFSVCDMEKDVDLGFARFAEAVRDKRKALGLE